MCQLILLPHVSSWTLLSHLILPGFDAFTQASPHMPQASSHPALPLPPFRPTLLYIHLRQKGFQNCLTAPTPSKSEFHLDHQLSISTTVSAWVLAKRTCVCGCRRAEGVGIRCCLCSFTRSFFRAGFLAPLSHSQAATQVVKRLLVEASLWIRSCRKG